MRNLVIYLDKVLYYIAESLKHFQNTISRYRLELNYHNFWHGIWYLYHMF